MGGPIRVIIDSVRLADQMSKTSLATDPFLIKAIPIPDQDALPVLDQLFERRFVPVWDTSISILGLSMC